MRCAIISPYLLARIARNAESELRDLALYTLTRDSLHRTTRATFAIAAPSGAATAADHPDRTIYDTHHTEQLPGSRVRVEGAPASADTAVDQAYDSLGDTFQFYLDSYGRHSINDRGLPLTATVHYGENYDNAFWNGSQMVFGDGDGKLFVGFTSAIDVIGHELTHGVIQYTANLAYHGQPGALNESISDVFGILVKQYTLKQDAADSDWLIGAGILGPHVHGTALRSMAAPGTAYDDPLLGKDPQPATMSGYVQTADDDGGVHTNSGIPNHAFYLAATKLGGPAWQRAGQVWYDTLTGGKLPTDASFATFAKLTVAAATTRFGAGEVVDAVQAAWQEVGIAT